MGFITISVAGLRIAIFVFLARCFRLLGRKGTSAAVNIYYDDLITGNILRSLKIRPLCKDAFMDYMKTQGKLGGQNKAPSLSNDRKIADVLREME